MVLRQARPGVTAIFFEFARLFIQLSREDRNHCVRIALIICAWFASDEPDRGAIDVGAGPQEATAAAASVAKSAEVIAVVSLVQARSVLPRLAKA